MRFSFTPPVSYHDLQEILTDCVSSHGKQDTIARMKPVRDALYVAALPSIRFDPKMKVFFQHLKQQGKPEKVALIAVM